MKTPLQHRAEQAFARFRVDGRKPIVIEFAGVPKAGKTSTISQVQRFFKRCGFRVQVVVERASVCPIRDKKHFTFNVWTASTTLAQVLENTQEPPGPDDPDLLILDRGLFDSVCWLTMMEKLCRIRKGDREVIERFLLSDEWRKRITGVIVMTVSPEDAMERESGYLPVVGGGSIMNREVLRQMLTTTKDCVKRLKDKFRIMEIDTTSSSVPGGGKLASDGPRRTAEMVAEKILSLVEEDLQEDVLHLPKQDVVRFFSGQPVLPADKARALLDAFVERGAFRPRKEVEADSSLVQALPVAVVRDKKGRLLCLRRRENEQSSRLHEKFVIWAGGHVRREDKANGNVIIQAALRELKEELRLNVEPDELIFRGSVFVDIGGKTSNHVALVFEWRADRDDVAVTLSSSEFFERRGTSLSGRFVSSDELPKEFLDHEQAEPWSYEILKNLLGTGGCNVGPSLFG